VARTRAVGARISGPADGGVRNAAGAIWRTAWTRLLNREPGLKRSAGVSGGMRDALVAEGGHEGAKLAYDVFVHPKSAVERAPRTIRRLPATFSKYCASHPPGDNCLF